MIKKFIERFKKELADYKKVNPPTKPRDAIVFLEYVERERVNDYNHRTYPRSKRRGRKKR